MRELAERCVCVRALWLQESQLVLTDFLGWTKKKKTKTKFQPKLYDRAWGLFSPMSQNSTQYIFTVYQRRMPVLFWLFCLVPLCSLLQSGLKSWWCAPPCVVHFSFPWPFHGPRTIPNIHSFCLTPPCLTLYTFFSSPRPRPLPSALHLPLSHSVSRNSSHSDTFLVTP